MLEKLSPGFAYLVTFELKPDLSPVCFAKLVCWISFWFQIWKCSKGIFTRLWWLV